MSFTQVYTSCVDPNQALEKARQFARTRYTGEMENIVRVHEHRKAEMHNRLAAKGSLLSGNMIHENARIDGEQVRALTESRLDALLEGYELYRITIDDWMAANLCDEIVQGMKQTIYSCKFPTFNGSLPVGLESQYPRMVEQAVGLSANLVKTEIDRRRLMAKKTEGSTTYNVQGENARVNVNSNDHSVNVVTKSKDEFFATLQQKIEAGVPEGEEKRKILTALTALRQSHGGPTFAQRYTDFIAVAANHVALLAPFIPALTEMLHYVLK
jgi:hypothetical protein